LAVVIAVLGLATGCRNQDAPPKELDLPPIGPVEAYGLRLDADAGPEKVAYVLMQAIRDDVQASRRHDREAQRKAMQLQLRLAAPAEIRRAVGRVGAESDPEQMRALVYGLARFWAPIAARYIDSFEGGPERVMKAMRMRRLDSDHARISYDVVDPADASPETGRVTFQVFLALEPGPDGKRYWRVHRLGYAPFGWDDRAEALHTQPSPATGPSATRPGTRKQEG